MDGGEERQGRTCVGKESNGETERETYKGKRGGREMRYGEKGGGGGSEIEDEIDFGHLGTEQLRNPSTEPHQPIA